MGDGPSNTSGETEKRRETDGAVVVVVVVVGVAVRNGLVRDDPFPDTPSPFPGILSPCLFLFLSHALSPYHSLVVEKRIESIVNKKAYTGLERLADKSWQLKNYV